jgi:hypothetical protein
MAWQCLLIERCRTVACPVRLMGSGESLEGSDGAPDRTSSVAGIGLDIPPAG